MRRTLQAYSQQSIAWLVFGITLFAAALRLYRIGASGLWTDEAFSVWAASRHSILEIWYAVEALDARPPLYHWLLHLWLRLGDSEGVLRLMSAIFGTLTVPLVFGIGRIIGGRDVGMMAAFLLSISPVNVHYSQEVRMYSLLPFAAAISILAMAWLLRSPGANEAPAGTMRGNESLAGLPPHTSHKRAMQDLTALVAYIVGTAAALWVHYPAAFLPISANIIVALMWPHLVHRRRFIRNWIVAQAIVVLLCIPLAPLYLYQSRGPNFPPIPPLSPVTVLEGLTPDLITLYDSFLLFLIAALLEIALLVAVVILAIRTWRRNGQWLAFALSLWLVPLAGEVITSAIWRNVLYPKLLIWTTIPFYVIVAAALAKLQARPIFRAVALAFLLFIAVSGLSANYWRQPEQEAWRPVAKYVAMSVRPGDLILFNDGYVELPFDYYFRHYHVAVVERGVPGNFGANSADEPIMTRADVSALRLLANSHKRLWLVYSHYWYTDPLHLVPKTLGEVSQLTDTRVFPSREPIVVLTYVGR